MSDPLPLLGYARPQNQAFTMSGGAFVDPGDVQIGGGNPGVMTRIQWPAGTPTIGQYVEIRSDFARPITPRIAVLSGLRQFGAALPLGMKVTILGKRAGDAGYTYNLGGDSQALRTSEQWNGAHGIWWELGEGLDPIIGWAARLYNDFTGATHLTAADYLDIGTIDPMAAVEFDGAGGYRWSINAPSTRQRTLGSQLHRNARVPYRTIEFGVAPVDAGAVHLAGLGGTNWQAVQYALSRGNVAALMLRPGTDLQQTESIYGDASALGDTEQLAYRLMQLNGFRIEEVPAQPA